MRWRNTNAKIESGVLKRMVVLIVFMMPMSSWSAFYQSTTMVQYCKEYTKLIGLEKPVNQLEAGICNGYIASKIEVMDLSEQLCERDKINLDNVVAEFIEYVEKSDEAKEHSATYVIVDLLQRKYACNEES